MGFLDVIHYEETISMMNEDAFPILNGGVETSGSPTNSTHSSKLGPQNQWKIGL